VERKELIDALSRLPEKDAQSVIAEARKNDRQQAKEHAAAALRQHYGPTRSTDCDDTEE